jgi:SH3-like domain-containing protein
MTMAKGYFGAAALALCCALPPAPAVAQEAAPIAAAASRGPVTNLPLPRYVSLKSSEGNARRGPSLSHRIDWVFRHNGMPLRVTAEYGNWRRVEDREGAGGWVHYALLSGVRTVIITPDAADLHARPDTTATVLARAEAGAQARLGACLPDWCRVAAPGAQGWVPKSAIWGVDADELRE